MNLDIESNSKTWYSRSWQFETDSIQIQLQDLAFQALAIELRNQIHFQDLAFQALVSEFRHRI